MYKMKFSYFLIIFILTCNLTTNAQNISWANRAGGTGSDQGYDVSTDNAGNTYACGWFSGTASFGSTTLTSYGLQDVFIACYNAAGTLNWVKQAGGTGNEVCAGIATTQNGDSYVTGWFSGISKFGDSTMVSNGSYDMFIAKYNSSGSLLWVRAGGGLSDDYGNRVSLTRNGGVLVSGSFRDTLSISSTQLISAGNRDVLLCSYDSTGHLTWAQRAGGAGEDRGYGVGQNANGDVYLTGLFTGKAKFNAIEVSGTALLSTYVAKLSEGGNFIWVKPGGGGANDFARGLGLKLEDAGNVICTGFFSGILNMNGKSLTAKGGQYDFDAYVTKLDANGNTIWIIDLGGDGIDQGTSVSVNKSGEIFVCGFYGETQKFAGITMDAKGLSDVFVAKLDTGGNIIWMTSAGGSGNDYAYGISCAYDGSIKVNGAFDGTGSYGSFTLQSNGGLDAFLLQIVPKPTGIHTIQTRECAVIYPNPANNYFNISLGVGNKKVDVIIYDLTGKIIYNNYHLETQNIVVSTKDFMEGVYFVCIQSEDIRETKKIIVAK